MKIFQQKITKLLNSNSMLFDYLRTAPVSYRYYILINLRLRRDEIFAIGSSGSIMPIVNKGNFSKLPIFRHSEVVLEIYGQYVSPLIKRINNNSFQIQILTKLRDTLLPKLISGELRIEDAEKTIKVGA